MRVRTSVRTFDLDARASSYWDTTTAGWVVAPGCYRVLVERSPRDIRVVGPLASAAGNAEDPDSLTARVRSR